MKVNLNIDFDKLVRELLWELDLAFKGWRSGAPQDETSLMNHITGRLNRRRRGCDIGMNRRVWMRSELYHLHRRGENQTDHYGSDFAVTIQVDDARLIKTALFQLKLSDGDTVVLGQSQLRDAANTPLLSSRSFVLGVNGQNGSFRVQPVKLCLNDFQINQREKTFQIDGWESVVQWVIGWFKCERGLPSKPQDPKGIEACLEHLRMIDEPKMLGDVWEANWPKEILPTKAWLKYRFTSE